MKKNLIAVAFAATAALSMSNAMAATGSGTVKFTGEILDAACTISTDTQDQSVVLGKYLKTDFKNTGDTTAATNFKIVLKDCPDTVTSAKVRFDGTPDTVNSDLLAVDSSVAGAATGVGINLMTADKADLPLHGANSYNYSLVSTADNTLDFYAQYKSTVASVTAGPANSVANFSVVYN